MDFSFPPEYIQLRNSVRQFLEAELRPLARTLDEERRFPKQVHQKAAALGFVGAHLPAEFGGSDDLLAKAVIHEENCRVNIGYNISVNASDLLFAGPVSRYGTADQKARYLPPIVRGEALGCWALTEPEAGSDALAFRTNYKKDGDNYVLNGTKTFISNAPIADYFVVMARQAGTRGKDGITAFVLERGMDGFETGPPLEKLGPHCSPTGEIFLDDVRVGPEQVLGVDGGGYRDMTRSLDVERATTPLTAIGLAQACLEASVRYAKQRQQFGKPLAAFQMIREKIADMAIHVELARTEVYKLIWMVQQGMSVRKEAAMLKVFASDMAMRAATEAIQIHGGYGLMKEYEVERFFRDVKLLQIGAGTNEIQKLVISHEVFEEYD